MLAKNCIFDVSDATFNEVCLDIFHLQYRKCQIYKEYVDLLNVSPSSISHYSNIPFLPISFFKTHKVLCETSYQRVFESSGTTGRQTSRHFVHDLTLYEESIKLGFEYFFGQPKNYRFLLLLPGYLERENSSLVYMMQFLVKDSGHNESGFYLRNHEELLEAIQSLELSQSHYMLFGVTYALLDLMEVFEQSKLQIEHGLLFETGGMKGKRKELVKEELHQILKTGFKVPQVFSEYGMTELLSQAYLMSDGKFHCPPWMKVMGREVNDPLQTREKGRSMGLNVIDLANLHSCSFIATEDIGDVDGERGFTVNGRLENSIARGCNMLL